ncbi:polysaccharide deacetylase family protein [Pseudoflavitalea rhizosphaerae]|uniref:polysaccharide deacetylase family protein n=1 Tax=Pseudoflavitalea rhizosphaerae TaxID=1884793 RepID=UPI000F8CD6B8|nr:polysaccharide deacetylase family protein [Pseudoflavitalea rhizosphaerae]
MAGIFTISLDFELHWGVFDKRTREERRACYQNTIAVIPRMLELFAQYDAHVTWATVGSLMAADRKEWERLKPAIEPAYLVDRYSPYRWVAEHDLTREHNWAHFAPEMVARIVQYPGQELGTHTFSHFYCLETQSEPAAFGADLEAAIRAALPFGSRPVSLVFPRNQFNPVLLKTCYEYGIQTVRSNPSDWYWTPVTNNGSSLIRKFARAADAYVQIGRSRSSYPLSSIKIIPGEPLQLPASRFLRPWRDKYHFANRWRVNRSIQEMKQAALHNECYHLWWHPENFGEYTEENMKGLERLLQHYQRYAGQYGMISWNMGEYAQYLRF